tara:strand:+ start:277 stop:486 length:210 start_codon:yes stop_codon:yes gene_type:complete
LNRENNIKTASHFNSINENKKNVAYKNKLEYALYLEQYSKYEESKKETERNVVKENNGKKCPDTLFCRP